MLFAEFRLSPPDAGEFGKNGELLLSNFISQRVAEEILGEVDGLGYGGELIVGGDGGVGEAEFVF